MHEDAASPSDRRQAGVDEPEIHLPAPTIWPAACALGITLVMFGFVTSHWFGIAGLALMAVAIARWIGEVMHDAR